jgi:hypothetical protein
MEGIEKPHMDKYKEITNNWNYDSSCTLTSLLVWDLENFKRLIFVVQSVQITCTVTWKEAKKGGEEEEARRHRTYNGAKCSIVERWFSVNANYFVKWICMQRIKYS